MSDIFYFAPPPGGPLIWRTENPKSGGVHHIAHQGGWIIIIEDNRGMKVGPNGIPATTPLLKIRYAPSGFSGDSLLQNDPSEFQLLWTREFDQPAMKFLDNFVRDIEAGQTPEMGDDYMVFPAKDVNRESVSEQSSSSESGGGSTPKPKKPSGGGSSGTTQGQDTQSGTQPTPNSLYVDYEVDEKTGELVLAGPYRGFPIVMWLTGPGRGQYTSISTADAEHFIETGEMAMEIER